MTTLKKYMERAGQGGEMSTHLESASATCGALADWLAEHEPHARVALASLRQAEELLFLYSDAEDDD